MINQKIIKMLLRDKKIINIILLIIVFTCLVTPYYMVLYHLKTLESFGEKYFRDNEFYLSVNRRRNDTLFTVYVSSSNVIINGNLIKEQVYSFSDFEYASKLYGEKYKLDEHECLISSDLAYTYNVSIGDYIRIEKGSKVYIYEIAGFSNYFPIITSDSLPDSLPLYVYDLNREQSDIIVGSYLTVIKSLREDGSLILKSLCLIYYFIAFIGFILAFGRYLFSIRKNVIRVKLLGFNDKTILASIIFGIFLVSIPSIIMGLSTSMVITDLINKIIYMITGEIIFSGLSISEYLTIAGTYLMISLSSSIVALELWRHEYEDIQI